MIQLLKRFLFWFAEKRLPDVFIGGKEDPYLLRWWVIPRNPWFNIYLHRFLRDDDDRALHDHPWFSVSILLHGGYKEHLPGGIFKNRKQGQVIFRTAKQPHRIELYRSWSWSSFMFRDFPPPLIEAWSLFITGPKIREWGFYCPKGWIHWEDFTAKGDSSLIGKGCDAEPTEVKPHGR